MSTEKIYSVYCHTCNKMQYIGVTCNVKRRWKPSEYKGTSLEPYIDKFGWDAITHEVLFENLTRDEALKIEDQLIVKARENGTCLNIRRSGHYTNTDESKEADRIRAKAYYEDHKEDKAAYNKAYYETHQEEEKARSKAYNETHKDEKKARDKAYNEEHKEDKAAYNKAYYEANKDKILARRREKRKRKKGGNKGRNKGLF